MPNDNDELFDKLEAVQNEPVETGESEFALRRAKLENAMNSSNPWNRSPLGIEAEKAAMAMLSTKHGMYAKVPITCKGESCPYAFQCELIKYKLAPLGERCPLETARMSEEFAGYAKEFDIDSASQTDRTLISEIISMDILLDRCQTLMAKEGTPVVDILAGISDSGEEIMQPAVSKAWEAFQAISKRRNDNMQLMMATRKDRKNDKDDRDKQKDILAEVISDPDFDKVEQRPEDIKDTDDLK
jgi:hypothetical protein